MIDPDSLSQLELEQLRFVAIKVTEQGQRWVSAMHNLRGAERGVNDARIGDNPHLVVTHNLAVNEVVNAREDYLVAIAGFLGFFLEDHEKGENPFFVCEYCLGTGCKTCGYTGYQLDPITGEPITENEKAKENVSMEHANVVAKTFNDNLLVHRVDNDQLTVHACICGYVADDYGNLIRHIDKNL
jgi:hypothetical protein